MNFRWLRGARLLTTQNLQWSCIISMKNYYEPHTTDKLKKKSKMTGDFDFWRCTQILWRSFINDWHWHTSQDPYWRLVTNLTVALSHTPHQSLHTIAGSNFQTVAVLQSLRIMCAELWTTVSRSSPVRNFPPCSGYFIEHSMQIKISSKVNYWQRNPSYRCTKH